MDPETELTSPEEASDLVRSRRPIFGAPDFQTTQRPIFRAPAHIRYDRKNDFEPKLVSIGPYYHGRENLKPMQTLKLRCLADLLKKRPVGGSNTDHVPVDQFMEFEQYARPYYKERFDHTDEQFVEMLVLDSCFIIRIVLSFSQTMHESMSFLDVNIKEVRSDLLLLENQIPLFFILKVYDWLFSRTDNPIFPPFITVLKPFICFDMPWSVNQQRISDSGSHLFEIYWRCSSSPEINYQLDFFQRRGFDYELPSWAEIHLPINAPKVIENATVLHQMAGINFQKLNNQDDERGLDVIFSNGIMRMPWLKIDPSQTALLVNLIAYENSMLPSMRTFSSYVKLMDELIDSEKDVELLQRCGVIHNTLSSHKMAATFFNDIGNFCLIDNNAPLFRDLYENVQKYYNTIWNRIRASFRQNYCTSPWPGISVGAGTVLLILAGLQTHYTIHPNK